MIERLKISPALCYNINTATYRLLKHVDDQPNVEERILIFKHNVSADMLINDISLMLTDGQNSVEQPALFQILSTTPSLVEFLRLLEKHESNLRTQRTDFATTLLHDRTKLFVAVLLQEGQIEDFVRTFRSLPKLELFYSSNATLLQSKNEGDFVAIEQLHQMVWFVYTNAYLVYVQAIPIRNCTRA